jgi:hypothetical protein
LDGSAVVDEACWLNIILLNVEGGCCALNVEGGCCGFDFGIASTLDSLHAGGRGLINVSSGPACKYFSSCATEMYASP